MDTELSPLDIKLLRIAQQAIRDGMDMYAPDGKSDTLDLAIRLIERVITGVMQ